jgi:nitroreductase
MFNEMLKKAIVKSQRCQRNWDLTKEIPEEDLEVIKTAATQCPSKQNIQFYKPYFITNRNQIETIHKASMGASTNDIATGVSKMNTNSQLLANLLVVLVEEYDYSQKDRNQVAKLNLGSHYSATDIGDAFELEFQHGGDLAEMVRAHSKDWERDRSVAVGIAAGYMNLVSSILGYSTGCCQCFDQDTAKRMLGISEDKEILLIMGIGFADPNRSRREHHYEMGQFFPSYSKEISAVIV